MITLHQDQSTNLEATEVCLVVLNRCCVVCVSVLQRGQYGKVCELMTDDLVALSWARVQRVCLGHLSHYNIIHNDYYLIFNFPL